MKSKKDKLKQSLPELYQKFTGREIAKQFNCSLSLVRQTIKEMGLQLGKDRAKKVTEVFDRKKGVRYYYDKRGYRFVKVSGKREREEHRVVIEEHIKRKLKTNETVHHIDGDKLNNNLDNLLLCGNNQHSKIHANLEKVAYSLIKIGVIKFDRNTQEYYVEKKFIDLWNYFIVGSGDKLS